MCIYQDKIRLGPDREAMLPLFRFLYWGAMMSLLLLFIFFFLLISRRLPYATNSMGLLGQQKTANRFNDCCFANSGRVEDVMTLPMSRRLKQQQSALSIIIFMNETKQKVRASQGITNGKELSEHPSPTPGGLRLLIMPSMIYSYSL